MKRKIGWLAALLLIATTAHAEEAANSKEIQAEPATHAWLEMQRSGRAASQQPQPLSGPVMDRVHERYLKGFEYPLPMYFEHAQILVR